MSNHRGGRYFDASELPSSDQLGLHVNAKNFLDCVLDRQEEMKLASDRIETIAEAYHDIWYQAKKGAGWRYGPIHDDASKERPEIVHWDDLAPGLKERSRDRAEQFLASLRDLGVKARRITGAAVSGPINGSDTYKAIDSEAKHELVTQLAMREHDLWLRKHMVLGYELHETTKEQLRLHGSFKPSEERARERNESIARAMIHALLAEDCELCEKVSS